MVVNIQHRKCHLLSVTIFYKHSQNQLVIHITLSTVIPASSPTYIALAQCCMINQVACFLFISSGCGNDFARKSSSFKLYSK